MNYYSLINYINSLSQEQKDFLLRAILVNMRPENIEANKYYTKVSFSVEGIRYSKKLDEHGRARITEEREKYNEALFALAAQMQQK